MRRNLLIVATAAFAVGALVVLAAGLAGPSASRISSSYSHTAQLTNYWPSGEAYYYNQAYPDNCARIDAAGRLIIGTGDCTGFTWQNRCVTKDGITTCSHVLVEGNGTGSNCLFYDGTGTRDGQANSFDIDSCSVLAAADEWAAGSNATYSEWENADAFDGGTGCMWTSGTGTSHYLFGDSCSGTDSNDRWEAVPIGDSQP